MEALNTMADIKHIVHSSKYYGLWNYIKLHITEKARKKRTCHICQTSIKRGERHLALYHSSASFWQMRTNICVFCLEDITKVVKKDIKGSIRERKKERELEMFVKAL